MKAVQLAVGVALSLGAIAAIAAPPKKRASTPRPVVDGITPQAYSEKVRAIASCEDFATRLNDLPTANSLLKRFALRPDIANGALEKDEFESSGVYQARLQQTLKNEIGDPILLVIDKAVDPTNMRYDADAGTMSMYRPFNSYRGEQSELTFDSQTTGVSTYRARNAYGASVLVEKTSITNHMLKFNIEAAERKSPSFNASDWKVRIAGQDAKALKDNGHVFFLVSLHTPYYQANSRVREAKLDYPYENRFKELTWYGRVRCAVWASGREQKMITLSDW
jgi:hypothetical protein